MFEQIYQFLTKHCIGLWNLEVISWPAYGEIAAGLELRIRFYANENTFDFNERYLGTFYLKDFKIETDELRKLLKEEALWKN